MNVKPKLIADIRYYENPGRTEYGNVRHDSLGTLYSIPFRSFGAIGDRFVCKLREREFTLPGFDHLYVILTPALPPGNVEPSTLNIDARIRYVDVGLLPDHWDSLNEDSKHDHIVDLTSFAINAFDGNADTLTKLLSANDVYPLCGSIAVRENTITIKPRSSSRAATITDKYNVPLSVAVDSVLAVPGTEIG